MELGLDEASKAMKAQSQICRLGSGPDLACFGTTAWVRPSIRTAVAAR